MPKSWRVNLKDKLQNTERQLQAKAQELELLGQRIDNLQTQRQQLLQECIRLDERVKTFKELIGESAEKPDGLAPGASPSPPVPLTNIGDQGQHGDGSPPHP
jgi:hypothetical protein